jgi:hypothetical protein
MRWLILGCPPLLTWILISSWMNLVCDHWWNIVILGNRALRIGIASVGLLGTFGETFLLLVRLLLFHDLCGALRATWGGYGRAIVDHTWSGGQVLWWEKYLVLRIGNLIVYGDPSSALQSISNLRYIVFLMLISLALKQAIRLNLVRCECGWGNCVGCWSEIRAKHLWIYGVLAPMLHLPGTLSSRATRLRSTHFSPMLSRPWSIIKTALEWRCSLRGYDRGHQMLRLPPNCLIELHGLNCIVAIYAFAMMTCERLWHQ